MVDVSAWNEMIAGLGAVASELVLIVVAVGLVVGVGVAILTNGADRVIDIIRES